VDRVTGLRLNELEREIVAVRMRVHPPPEPGGFPAEILKKRE
jgi:hypothetical protein